MHVAARRCRASDSRPARWDWIWMISLVWKDRNCSSKGYSECRCRGCETADLRFVALEGIRKGIIAELC